MLSLFMVLEFRPLIPKMVIPEASANPFLVAGAIALGAVALGVVGFGIWWLMMHYKYKDGGSSSSLRFQRDQQRGHGGWGGLDHVIRGPLDDE